MTAQGSCFSYQIADPENAGLKSFKTSTVLPTLMDYNDIAYRQALYKPGESRLPVDATAHDVPDIYCNGAFL